MIDNLLYQIQQLKTYDCTRFSTYSLKGNANGYIFLTLHRPSNVDSRETFEGIAAALNHIAEDTPIFFPVHPRTKKMMGQFAL